MMDDNTRSHLAKYAERQERLGQVLEAGATVGEWKPEGWFPGVMERGVSRWEIRLSPASHGHQPGHRYKATWGERQTWRPVDWNSDSYCWINVEYRSGESWQGLGAPATA